jgi:hypothetical protein
VVIELVDSIVVDLTGLPSVEDVKVVKDESALELVLETELVLTEKEAAGPYPYEEGLLVVELNDGEVEVALVVVTGLEAVEDGNAVVAVSEVTVDVVELTLVPGLDAADDGTSVVVVELRVITEVEVTLTVLERVDAVGGGIASLHLVVEIVFAARQPVSFNFMARVRPSHDGPQKPWHIQIDRTHPYQLNRP